MTEGDIALASLPQADGHIKNRPVLLLRRLPPFDDFLVCGISTDGEYLYFYSNRENPHGANGVWRIKTNFDPTTREKLVFGSGEMVLQPASREAPPVPSWRSTWPLPRRDPIRTPRMRWIGGF
jgi:hypothetical protein